MSGHHHHAPPASHEFLRDLSVAFVPGETDRFLEEFSRELARRFEKAGHRLQETPDRTTDLILTSAPFGKPVGWREAALFFARRRFRLDHSPLNFAIVHAGLDAFEQELERLERALRRAEPDPDDYDYPGLAPDAWRVLHEQGRRGGPLLALERLVQSQAKSLRIVLVVGDDAPLFAYHFDLVGAHPRSEGGNLDAFYEDVMLRIVTAASTEEITDHAVVDGPLPLAAWKRLSTPSAMTHASEQLGRRGFFTDAVVVGRLVKVPAVSGAVASQYSEGCFATWEPSVEGLVATVTGSARPVDKGRLAEDDLALIVGVREDGRGALVREIEGRDNAPPSSEAVEMVAMDAVLPRTRLGPGRHGRAEVPVVRSKLHGHRGVAAFDPAAVEYVPLDPAYHHYLVSCASGAQAQGVQQAFARSATLQDPADPRPLAFTILPGHGVIVAEKWVNGTVPFQTIWEHMDSGALRFDAFVPQGPLWYSADWSGTMRLELPGAPDARWRTHPKA